MLTVAQWVCASLRANRTCGSTKNCPENINSITVVEKPIQIQISFVPSSLSCQLCTTWEIHKIHTQTGHPQSLNRLQHWTISCSCINNGGMRTLRLCKYYAWLMLIYCRYESKVIPYYRYHNAWSDIMFHCISLHIYQTETFRIIPLDIHWLCIIILYYLL
jgi:hypothetical protein